MSRYTYRDAVRSKKLLYITGMAVVLIITALLVFRHLHQDSNGKREMEAVRKMVSKLIILPQDEDPTLATVKDKNQLRDAFLKANADNGDKVLVYGNAQKVYIYRPSAGKLVAMGPLNIDASAAQVQGARVQVRTGNGSVNTGERIRETLVQSYPSAKIGIVDQSKRQDYPTTIIIDLSEDKYELVSNMMQQLGAQRGVLPQGEAKPENVDILIITGLDKP